MAAAVGVMIVPHHVSGGAQYQAPSDKVNVAAVGCSPAGMGANDINALLEGTSNNVAALCDVDASVVA